MSPARQPNKSELQRRILAYYEKLEGNRNDRYRSWEHCYLFFQGRGQKQLRREDKEAALQLGFYLASWGMYRGSGFLLDYDYLIHVPAVNCIASSRFSTLWNADIGSQPDHFRLRPLIVEAVEAVRESYRPFGRATDTLVTKVILGTLGCLPASDRYFLLGFKSAKNSCSCVNTRFVESTIGFCQENLAELQAAQGIIERRGRIRYPLMKLIDMYFWERGFEAVNRPSPH